MRTPNRKRNHRSATQYANENVIQAIKVLEALEGANFEPVSMETIIERVGIIAEIGKELSLDKCRRILLTLQLLGWATQNEKKKWILGSKILRFSNRHSEVLIANSNR